MTALATFFTESDTSFGVFYPKHYIAATFGSYAIAKNAELAVRKTGYGEHEVLAAPGTEVLNFFEEVHSQTGLWGDLMTQISRFFGTEATLVDDDIQRAREGAGFVAIHCPDEPESVRLRDLLAPFSPIAMHWYLAGGIRRLV